MQLDQQTSQLKPAFRDVMTIVILSMCMQVDELEKALTEANKRLTRIDEADKRFVSTPGSSPSAVKAETKPTPDAAAPAKQ